MPIIVHPLLGKEGSVHPLTAGSIIFRFRVIEQILKFSRLFWSFFILVNFWVLASWTVVGFFIWLTISLTKDDSEFHVLFYLFYLLYIGPLILPLTPIGLAFNRTKFRQALRDLTRGIFAYTLYFFKWSFVLLAMAAGITAILSFLPISLAALTILPGDEKYIQITTGLFILAAIITVTRPLYIFIRSYWDYVWTGKRKNVSGGKWYVRRFLDFYGLGSALADNYGLKRFLVDIFDPNYYGAISISPVIRASLKDSDKSIDRLDCRTRRLVDYVASTAKNKTKIVVAVAAADVASGKLGVVDADSPIVDSLLAATAMTPIYPPVSLNDRLYVDGTNVGNVPTKALVELLNNHGIADVKGVHIYAVDSLPVSKPVLGPYSIVGDRPYVNLIDIAIRALQLQRYRDATIERKLTNIISDVIPPGEPTVTIRQDGKSRWFFRSSVAPIELEHAAHLNRKILFSEKDARRTALAETIADGCRAALEVMLTDTLTEMRNNSKWQAEKDAGFIKCSKVIEESKKRDNVAKINLRKVSLPGCGDDGPGVAEICKFCALRDQHRNLEHDTATQSLRFRESELPDEIGDWPHELGVREDTKPIVEAKTDESAPKDSEKSVAVRNPNPIRACLFSGGVFRGVFQMGVLNALGLLKMRPDMVAGASIGSITAAMVAKALLETDESATTKRITDLATVYLGIDRIILTDRFADFIRNWTIRAAEAKFSLRQADEVFRKYDDRSAKVFQKNLREVVAGLERLFYINPYQLNELVSLTRNRQHAELGGQLKDRVQQWLDRMNVGDEVLGAEPIRLLIEQFVIPQQFETDPESAPFNCFGDDFYFLATTTNLTLGCLKVIGSHNSNETVSLLEGLLASSAFPGVFRPRLSWDLMPGTNESDQYIDGGVMDNLPVDAVLEAIRALATEGQVALRPERGPHLMLAASLEVVQRKGEGLDLKALEKYWPELSSRAKELKYNIKLDTFACVARNIQDVYKQTEGGTAPLDVKVLAIKPKWLCNTFAFHPMLGFRRSLQAKSIAHGCAATLLAFGGASEHSDAWRLDRNAIPECSSFEDALQGLRKSKRDIRKGRCWLQDKNCPFSAVELNSRPGAGLDKATRYWLSQIHENCWERQTHER